MSEEKVVLTDSKVIGDLAGRDIDKSKKYIFSGSKTNYMQILLKKFKEEENANAPLQAYLEDLDYYNNKRTGDVIGLEEKLTLGDRSNFIDFAIGAKEKYHRKLYRYQFSEAAQLINIHLLGLVISYFENEIKPLIVKGEDEQFVNSMITERLIKPILDELDENLLGFSAHDINGMIYFLTGNCHINWKK